MSLAVSGIPQEKLKIIPIRYQWRGIWVGIQFIYDGRNCVIVDSGIGDAVSKAVVPELKKHDIPISAVSLVINTHYHSDHAGGNSQLRALSDARFAIHESGLNPLKREQNFSPDIRLGDGTKITEGDIELEVIHTPGHSADSICILEPSTGTLFAGDSIQGSGIAALGLPLWQDFSAYRDSVNKLLHMYCQGRFNKLFLGHHFLPGNGVLSGDEIGIFLQTSLKTIDEYTAFAAAMKGCDRNTFYNQLLKRYDLKPDREWASTARNMAGVILRNSK